MGLYENALYLEDVAKVASLDFDWEQLRGKTMLVTGASGMIGSFLIDVLMEKKLRVKIIAVGRNAEKAKSRFVKHWNDPCFRFVSCDINQGIDGIEAVDYIIHAASNTHPVAYSTDPVGTILTNTIGSWRLLEFAVQCRAERFVFASSVEVYGENRGSCDRFAETDFGYIDCNTLRAGYPEGKRVGEAMCQAYIKQHGLDIVIPRLSRTYGPTMLASDTKAISQFIKKGVAGEDIVLKSAGTQLYSYSYVADAVSGVLCCLFNGVCGEAYNIADPESDITLKDLAALIAEHAGKKVVFELPDAVESAGYSKATKAILDGSKLKAIGWKPMYTIAEGIVRTVDILAQL